jgi:hypothetical protein
LGAAILVFSFSAFFAACCGGGAAAGAAGATRAAGGGAAGATVAALGGGATGGGGGGGAAAAGLGMVASTAAWQPGDSFARLCCRHSSASLLPGEVLMQLAMKSDRQLAFIALFCASVGCASTGLAAAAANASKTVARTAKFPESMVVPLLNSADRNFRLDRGRA